MPTSRPTTPAAISDTSSDPGSLSDLDSGWTDLESNRSSDRRSPTISENGDSDEARSIVDRLEGEAWEGLTPESGEHDRGHQATDVIDYVHPPNQDRPSEPSLEDWVSDAMRSSLLSDDNGLHFSTPQASVSSPSVLRLSFPDPLSSSDHDLLPSHFLSPNHQRTSDHATPQLPSGSSAHHESSPAAALSILDTNHDLSFSPPEHEEVDEEDVDLPSVELSPPAGSYALSVMLLGHPPLPHTKRMTMAILMGMVAQVLDCTPRDLEGSEFSRIYEVPFYPREKETQTEQPMQRVLISDLTSGLALTPNFNVSDCPTLALVFIQPPLSPPSIPALPHNTRYIPLLLPSVSDGFASSLLDLSPSVLFDHSVPGFTNADNASRKSFALQQCNELDIVRSCLVETEDILTVEEFIQLPSKGFSAAIKAMLFPPKETLNAAQKVKEVRGTVDSQGAVTNFRKQLVFISAFLFAVLFGSTVLYHSFPDHGLTGQKVWSFFRPFMNHSPTTLPSRSRPSPASVKLPESPQSVPASLRSLAISVFRPESTVASPATEHHPTKGKSKRTPSVDNNHEVRPASIDPAVRHLTLDGPSTKSISLVSRAQLAKGKGKGEDADASNDAQLPSPSSTTSLSKRITNALSPLYERVNQDIREIQEAIDVLLHALWKLKGQASRGFGEVVQVLSKRAGRRAENLASQVQQGAQSVGERVSERHARAKFNARKVRDVGEQYVSAAVQTFGWGFERARGNAKVLKDGLDTARKVSRWGKEEARKLRRAAREERKSAKKEARAKSKEGKRRARGEVIFQSVMALVA